MENCRLTVKYLKSVCWGLLSYDSVYSGGWLSIFWSNVWKQQVPLTSVTITRLHGFTTQKSAVNIYTVVKTSNLYLLSRVHFS